MSRHTWILAWAAALCAVSGCASTGTTTGGNTAVMLPPPTSPVVVRATPGVVSPTPTPPPAVPAVTPTAAAPKPALQATSTIPAGARYTLFVERFEDANHLQAANALKQQLVASTGWPGWYVIHDLNRSSLYFGFYSEIDTLVDDKKARTEATRAKTEREQIAALHDAAGQATFGHTLFVPLAAPDPSSPPEWNISNSPAAYTLEVAVYTGSPNRKQMAVEAVRAARASGVEAYYHHGESYSSVCVGAWPAEAVSTKNEDYRSTTEGETVVLSSVPLPNIPSNKFDDQGKKVKTVTPETVILDPTINQMKLKFPVHSINGYEDTVQVQTSTGMKPQRRASILMHIPRDEKVLEGGDPGARTDQLTPKNRSLNNRLKKLTQ